MADWQAIYEALKAYPPQKLGVGSLRAGEYHCALGALVAMSTTTEGRITDVDCGEVLRGEYQINHMDIDVISVENDKRTGQLIELPEARYERMLAWVLEKAG